MYFLLRFRNFLYFSLLLAAWRFILLPEFYLSISLLFSYFNSLSPSLSYLSVCLSTYLSVYFFLHSLSPYLHLYQSISPSTISLSRSLSYLYIFLPVYLFISTSTLSPFSLSLLFSPSIWMSLCVFLCYRFSLYLYIYLSLTVCFFSLFLFSTPLLIPILSHFLSFTGGISLSVISRSFIPHSHVRYHDILLIVIIQAINP